MDSGSKGQLELVLELEPHQIDEALCRSGVYGNSIPGIRYLYEEMRHRGWRLGDAATAFEWLQAVERKFSNLPHPNDWDEGRARYWQSMWSTNLHRETPVLVSTSDQDMFDYLYVDIGGEG